MAQFLVGAIGAFFFQSIKTYSGAHAFFPPVDIRATWQGGNSSVKLSLTHM